MRPVVCTSTHKNTRTQRYKHANTNTQENKIKPHTNTHPHAHTQIQIHVHTHTLTHKQRFVLLSDSVSSDSICRQRLNKRTFFCCDWSSPMHLKILSYHNLSSAFIKLQRFCLCMLNLNSLPFRILVISILLSICVLASKCNEVPRIQMFESIFFHF